MAKGNSGNRNVSVVGGGGTSAPKRNLTTKKAENDLYNLPKRASEKQILQIVNDAPNGTIFAYRSGQGNQQVLEKVNNGISSPIFVQITMTDTGMSIGTPQNAIRSIQSAIRAGDTLGLSGEYKKRYKKNAKAMIREYGVG